MPQHGDDEAPYREPLGNPSAHSGWTRATESLCPICLKKIQALIFAHPNGPVVMEKHCMDHGPFQAILSDHPETYDRLCRSPRVLRRPMQPASPEAAGCPEDCGLCPSHLQHTCLAVLEITSRCNLGCPLCLAAASWDGRDRSVEEVESALRCLLDQEGRAPPLQLSGGEPTLHPELPAILRKASSLGFSKLEIDSNGLLLAEDPSLARKLLDCGLSQVYLQMDGLRSETSVSIRGKPLEKEKRLAVENCRKAGLPVALSVTVVPNVNENHLWEMVRYAMAEELTGVHFQSAVRSGRVPAALLAETARFTLAHFLRHIERQSEGQLRARDFIPLPCPDPRCGAMLYALVRGGRLLPAGRVFSEKDLLHHVADMSDWDSVLAFSRVLTPGTCGCCASSPSEPGSDPARLDCDFFSIGFHGMMDALDLDLDRARHCCVHELLPDGRLVPFCLFNVKYRNQNRNQAA